MVIPLKDPRQTVVGVISVLRGHDGSGGSTERFGEEELNHAPVNIGLLVQLITWASTASRHTASQENRKRLMDVITLIADTQDAYSGESLKTASKKRQTASHRTDDSKKPSIMRLDELLELARVSLSAESAVLHTLHKSTGFLHMSIVKRGTLKAVDEHMLDMLSDEHETADGLDAAGKGDMSARQKSAVRGGGQQRQYGRRKPSNTYEASEEERLEEEAAARAQLRVLEADWERERQLRRCSMGQGLIGFSALTGESINTELARGSGGRLTDPRDQLDIGVDIPPGVECKPMAMVAIPIIDTKGGGVVGVLQILNAGTHGATVSKFTSNDLTILQIISTAFAMSM